MQASSDDESRLFMLKQSFMFLSYSSVLRSPSVLREPNQKALSRPGWTSRRREKAFGRQRALSFSLAVRFRMETRPIRTGKPSLYPTELRGRFICYVCFTLQLTWRQRQR